MNKGFIQNIMMIIIDRLRFIRAVKNKSYIFRGTETSSLEISSEIVFKK